jgi:N-acetylmuramoyl-L-alanine amidase
LNCSSRKRRLAAALWLLACFTVAGAGVAQARVHRSEAWAREHFAIAERMREALNGRAPNERTRHDYQRVVNAYRAVYLGAPGSTKADPSVVAVAETMVEMGRRFEDDQILNKAIEQYKFLRKEYPGSKYRFDGLFTIGEIYKDDLNNPEEARATFEEFLRRYPHNRLADDARHAIEDLKQQSEAQTAQAQKKKAGGEKDGKRETKSAKNEPGADEDKDAASKDEPAEDSTASVTHAARFPRVTAIRHWSTPDYTRVAIDLESEVKFSSQRIASPARIYFDLKDTKLASTLVGKSFDVDDGFLKKVRVAQFAPGRTRVVLEVDNLSEYDAFLLPNPYRLIIDIHGKNGDIHGKNGHAKPAENASNTPDTAYDAVPAPSATDADAAEAETKATPTKAKKIEPAAAAADAEPVSASSGNPSVDSAAAKKAQSGVVKKIVEADDDESTATNDAADEAVPAKHVKKLNSHEGIVVDKVAKADKDDAPENADSDNTNASASGNAATRGKGSSRTLASNHSSSAYDLNPREARPTASGDRSLIRALGLKIGKIVIDPGHGGHDTGTIGPNGLEEKDLVLEVGRRLGKLLETRLGAEVVYTRKDDTFIPLETRTAIANQARADLFISIHANSSHDPDARGVETYYLNFTSSPDALDVAARENAVSEKSIYELQDLVKKIAMKEKIEESREFASDVQASLHSGLSSKAPAIRDRGVKKAPFIVLIGANMPSILAEISFVSNPADEHRLATSEYRERIAESLYRGIAKYVNGLSGVKVASKMDKTAGQ